MNLWGARIGLLSVFVVSSARKQPDVTAFQERHVPARAGTRYSQS